MTDLEHKAVKQSLTYNRKYSEDRDLEKVLKHPEEYVDSYAYTMNIVQMLRQKAYRDGFIAGAKENEFVWHDLRKNPNDLPEDTYDVLDQAGNKVHYNFFQNVWVNKKDEIDNQVITWCEIPKFKEEECQDK